ncbi:NusB antitermination factor [Desulfacinum hydrothermale DSM 13146]|uniref:Transcription antitermination protein NusB n=1 Tax=Desulfacinum hydrothermale DSM 13146 TaxID=1121390 RepID=A0A1W1X761_9BACT|nr:transcription antitermination factor NusB [Desulfacinum hydrothermale]SMC19654.1 NusB antitermination factor [Desulfacinum hydrothermale DSM 13146]
MGLRRQARELALQVLYQMDFNQMAPERAFDLVCRCFEVAREPRAFAKLLVDGVCLHKEAIDQRLAEASENWRVERMSSVDRNILRIALYEMFHRDDIPPRVSINEAIELAKRFGTEDSRSFVNGVLDKLFHTKQQKEDKAAPAPPKQSPA